MKKVIFASVLALGLAACGGGGKAGEARAAMVKSCVEDGGEEAATCECFADDFVENASPELLDLIVEASKSDDFDQYMSDNVDMEQMMTTVLPVMMGAATKCGISM